MTAARRVAAAKTAYWFPLGQAANAFGCTRRIFHSRVRPLLPPEATRVRKGQVYVHVRAAIDAWVAHKLPARPSGAEALEDLRRQSNELKVRQTAVQIERAELRLAQERGQLVPQEDILTTYTLLGAGLRGAAERLATRFGPAAADELRGTLDDLEQRLIPALRGPQEERN